MADIKPELLLVTLGSLDKQPMALKIISHFRNSYNVTVTTTEALDTDDVSFEIYNPNLKQSTFISMLSTFLNHRLGKLPGAFWLSYWLDKPIRSLRKKISKKKWDVVIAYNVRSIPLAASIKNKKIFLVDMQEYFPLQYDHSNYFIKKIAPFYEWICSSYLEQADFLFTVSPEFAKQYNINFGVTSHVIYNATPYESYAPALSSGKPIRLVHSGIAATHRKLEVMIDAVKDSINQFDLDLFLIPDEDASYFQKLKDSAEGYKNINVFEGIEYHELVQKLHNYDLGISIIAPTTYNHKWTIPNKIFDYIQARLGVVVGPSPEMAKVVDSLQIGRVLEGFEASHFKEFLDTVTVEQVNEWKQNSDKEAKAFSGETQMEKLQILIDKIIK